MGVKQIYSLSVIIDITLVRRKKGVVLVSEVGYYCEAHFDEGKVLASLKITDIKNNVSRC